MKRSHVWNYFYKTNIKEATCRICSKLLKTCGNTTNLIKHLKIHSDSQLKDATKPRTSKIVDRKIYKQSSIIPSTSNKVISRPQSSRNDFKGETQHKSYIRWLLYFICVDNRPFDVIKGKGFRRLMKEVLPSFKIPDVDLLKNNLDLFYEIKQSEAAEHFNKLSHYSLTCDIWTETMTTMSYLGLTAHFLDGNQVRSRCIATVQLEELYTADDIAMVLEDKCLQFNIAKEKITCVVTDNGPNVVSAVEKFVGISKHLPCFAHRINLLIGSIIKIEEVESLCSKVRCVVRFILGSVVQSDLLKSRQMGTPLKLVLDVGTRCNSVFYMLDRYYYLASLIQQILSSCPRAPPLPTAYEINEIKQLLKFLKPLECVTTEMSGEQHVAVSKVIPIFNTLKNRFEKIPVDHQSAMIKSVKFKILFQLQYGFGDIDDNLLLSTATLLDPRFKEVPFDNKVSCDTAKEHIRSLKINANSSMTSDTSDSAFHKYDFWQHYKSLAHGTASNEDELTAFLKGPVLPLKCDPHMQWEDMKNDFPDIYKLALEYLPVPATSIPSERLFSKAGATISKMRNALVGKYLDKVLFLGDCNEKEWDL